MICLVSCQLHNEDVWQTLRDKVSDRRPSQVMEQFPHANPTIGGIPRSLEVPKRLTIPMKDEITLTLLESAFKESL
jgi:hypothetical protein